MTKEEMKGERESVTLYTSHGGGEGIKSSDGGRRHKPGITLKKETGFWRALCVQIAVSCPSHDTYRILGAFIGFSATP